MTTNKKFVLIELFVFVIPLAIAWMNSAFSSLKDFSWGYNHINTISSLALIFAIVGNLYIYWQTRKSFAWMKVWKTISLALVFIFIILLYLGYSVSNFGF